MFDPTISEDQLTQSSLPTVDMSALMPFLVVSSLLGIVLTVLFIAYLVYIMVRRRKVENATFAMQKDLRIIRELLEAKQKVAEPQRSSDETIS